jgi:hypothetical protein
MVGVCVCVCVCAFFCVCVVLCIGKRPCDELITRPRSSTVCKMIKKLRNQPYAPKWEQAPKSGARGGKKMSPLIFHSNPFSNVAAYSECIASWGRKRCWK